MLQYYGVIVMKLNPSTDSFNVCERCLANINKWKPLPVMVFIHGGAFAEGNGDDDIYGPDFLLEKGVILVTFNYRLGVFGFLNFDTSKYSGNMAMKDQLEVLKWVHKNIERFGGDTTRITLFGESAGSSMTHMHVLSSESRKYFNNAIGFSGVVQNAWAISKTSDQLDVVNQIAQDFNLAPSPVEELIASIQNLAADEISIYGDARHLLKRTFFTQVAPVVESKPIKLPLDSLWNFSLE